ncbi:MAG: ABC transporter substrate-binding protein [Terriglobales bacterium]
MKRETLKPFLCVLCVLCGLGFVGCTKKPDPGTLVMIIESSPSNLDPRIGIDAQSERIDELLFDALLRRDEHFQLQPWLATSWEIPDPLTYIFHLRRDVRFHDGRPLAARDVKWTFDSILNRSVRTTKTGSYRFVDRIDAPDDSTVVFHLNETWAALLWNLSNGAVGIVPYGSGADFYQHPVGSGPFRFVSAEQDRDVVIERNDQYWRKPASVSRVRFTVVPDATTRALELRKGSADVALNSLSPDMAVAMRKDPSVEVQQTPGTILSYLAFNLHDPILKDVRVRQALAYAIDRRPMIQYLWRDQARPAYSVLPSQSWAYDDHVPRYEYDPARARALLDAAGYRATNGVRFRLTMKTSTEETTRLLAAVLQQQLRQVGIELDIRTFEFATFFSDVQKGAFQLYSLRWIGGNNDPDIFQYVFHSAFTPPRGANRGSYANPEVDKLIDEGRRAVDEQQRRRIYARLQQLLAEDLPYIDLWYYDNVVVHTRRTQNFDIGLAGNYDFLTGVEISAGGNP